MQPRPRLEGGNAITLTLLGLSLAILTGVTVLYLINRSSPTAIQPVAQNEETQTLPVEEPLNPRAGWHKYTDDQYDFSLEYPNGWIVATGTVSSGDPVVSVFPAKGTSTTLVYDLDDTVAHVSVYPHGVAKEDISGEMKASEVIITVPQASAKDLQLSSGKAWATKAVFDQYPETWNSAGFLFARLVIEEEELVYKRGDTVIEQFEFDAFSGDHIERSGFVDSAMRGTQEEILKSFTFTEQSGEGEQGRESWMFEEPLAESFVRSPLTVRGVVPRALYTEDALSILLTTDRGDVVTESSIVNLEVDEGAEVIPFELSLVFEMPQATSGVISLMEQVQGSEAKARAQVQVLF